MEKEEMSFILSGHKVLDSSVVIKWFRGHEILGEQALELRQAYLDGRVFIHVPDLLVYEIANVLRYKPDMNRTKVQQALQSLFDMGIWIEYIGSEMIEAAVEIAYACDITVYDAAFVALASQLEVDFITADQELVRKLHDTRRVYHLADLARL
jgi:predicted nucleic acid-binding protein